MWRSLVLAGCVLARASAQLPPEPGEAELAAARGDAAAILRPILVEGAGTDSRALVERFARAAKATTEPARRCFLLHEAIECARAAGDVDAALLAVDRLGESFAIDVFARRLAMLGQLAKDARAPSLALVAAAFASASANVESLSDARLRQALALATELAKSSGDASLVEWTESTRGDLLASSLAWRDALGQPPGSQKQLRYRCLYRGLWDDERHLSPEGRKGGEPTEGKAAEPDESMASCVAEAERVLRMAGLDAQPLALRNVRSRALHWLARAFCAKDASDRARVLQRMDEISDTVGGVAGLGSLRFPGDALPRSLVINGGEWKVEDGLLLGKNSGRAARATLATAWRKIDEVTIRGGIRSADNLNFRIAVGELNALLNWEVAEESHFYLGETRVGTTPPLLARGKEHTIRIRQLEGAICVTVDGKEVCTAPGQLAGTVSVYPALGSEIFVREVLVRGEIDPRVVVKGPIGTAR